MSVIKTNTELYLKIPVIVLERGIVGEDNIKINLGQTKFNWRGVGSKFRRHSE